MDQDTRNKLQRTTQRVRRILEQEFAEQLEGTFDILADGTILPVPGKHLDARQRLNRQKLVDAIEHIKAGGKKPREAVGEYTREAAFTFLNRFVALRMLESRGLLQECVSQGDQSSGFKEFCGLAPGLAALPDGGYRLYLECLSDELSVEVKVLFDRRDPASLMWPRRGALTELLESLGHPDLADVWSEDETIGWIYQYFNNEEDKRKARYNDYGKPKKPDNSRELAVRNQFFTPRYVVEFLTDNTLGRIWYEMRQGQTRLVDECSYLVCRPNESFLENGQEPSEEGSDAEQDLSQGELPETKVYIPYRGKRDPRDLKILDPACGSGHFLIYAFDLLISIYDEAWQDEASPVSGVTQRRLREDYPKVEQLHAALPGLVLDHNLHGIDIDPRAAQIAALALWMRGQRTFNEFGITREKRLPVARSNIVCAEPMPGEAAFRDEFIADHLSEDAEGRLLANLVRKVFQAMKLAGEAGSLLKIEEDIADEVLKAKKQWLERPEYSQQRLFDDAPKTVQTQLDLTRGITDESFWEDAEQTIYDALRAYSDWAERSGGFQRRLFAADTSRGFAFIDLCRNRYDVTLMNPPFGDVSQPSSSYVRRKYKNGKNDIYGCFLAAAIQRRAIGGMIGAITSRTWMFLPRRKAIRKNIVCNKSRMHVVADLGRGVLDGAMVETCAFVLAEKRFQMDTCFIRAIDAAVAEKEIVIRAAIQGDDSRYRFLVAQEYFEAIPGSPIAYWISPALFQLLATGERFDASHDVAPGLTTRDNPRFCRLAVEVPRTELGNHWHWFAKGGGFSPYYFDTELVINYDRDGLELKAWISSLGESVTTFIANQSYYRCPGFTYPRVTDKGFNVRILRSGHVFAEKGISVFPKNGEEPDLATLVFLNSGPIQELLLLLSPSRSWEKSFVAALPNVVKDVCVLRDFGEQIVQIIQSTVSRDVTSNTFHRPYIANTFKRDFAELLETQSIEADRVRTATLESSRVVSRGLGLENEGRERFVGDARESMYCNMDVREYAVNLADYFLGVAVGRWDIRCLERPEEPTSKSFFRELPQFPLGMLVCSGEAGEQSADLYPLSISQDGILPDDEGHQRDLEARIVDAIGIAYVDAEPESNLELCQGLGARSVREYFASAFFDDHVKRYTKSKRRAPIYWQLATLSRSYSIWLYYHRFTKDTFFKVLNEYVKPKLDHERKKLDRLLGEAGAEPTRSQRKEIEDQEKFVAELASMVEEVERIAPLWNPNLNDGVIINFAPLWRLVPQNKSWQKECKKVWDKLVAGDYDWAHLAMHLWPERVVPKCVTDASLAIAHGLEETFWTQDEKDRFQPLEEPIDGWQTIIDQLVQKRTSPAVKAALESLLNAPGPAATARRRGNNR